MNTVEAMIWCFEVVVISEKMRKTYSIGVINFREQKLLCSNNPEDLNSILETSAYDSIGH